LKSPAFSRTARYSGRYRPAWRMIHTGVTSTGCLSNARNNLSFLSSVIKEISPQRRKERKEIIKKGEIRCEAPLVFSFAFFAPLR
jgi:hypothetical protein